MEWKTLIDRRSNCVICIVDAHKQIQQHNSARAMELLIDAKTLFTKSSPRRAQRAAVLIVVFVVNETVEDHSATDRPIQETRSPHSVLIIGCICRDSIWSETCMLLFTKTNGLYFLYS